jgi:hypothetical protein
MDDAAITNVPEWLVRLAILILSGALVCAFTVLVVLGLVDHGYLPR